MAKIGNFRYKFATQGKSRGPLKIEYRCITTNLPVCNAAIVLEFTLLNSVYVFTNFVTRKRYKQVG